MSPLENLDRSAPEPLESLIAGAGKYVVPTEDLRPRILEDAKEQQGLRSIRCRLFYTVAAVCLCFACVEPWLESTGRTDNNYVSPSASVVQQQALQRAHDLNISADWALQETISNLRQLQARRLKMAP